MSLKPDPERSNWRWRTYARSAGRWMDTGCWSQPGGTGRIRRTGQRMRAENLADPGLLAHYEELGPAWAPMRDLLQRLRHQEYAEALPAATSHDALVIGGERGSIAVTFFPDERAFEVRLWEMGRVERRRCGALDAAAEAERLVDAYVLRLELRGTAK